MSESYQGSRAAVGLGTQIFVNGKRVGEVTELSLSTSVELTANWIPDDAGQIEIMENHKVPVRIELQHPNWVDSALFFLPVEYWYIHITPINVMTFNVLFRRPDSAVEDGPEVNAILKERAGEIVEGFNKLATAAREFSVSINPMTKETADKIVAHVRQVLAFNVQRRERAAGGGFTEVFGDTLYGRNPDGSPITDLQACGGQYWFKKS